MTGEPAKGPVDISHTNIKTQNRSLTCLYINILWHFGYKILRHNLIVYNFGIRFILTLFDIVIFALNFHFKIYITINKNYQNVAISRY